MKIGAMTNHGTKTKVSSLLLLIPIFFMIFYLSYIHSNDAFAAGKFSVEAKIDLKSLDHPDKLKVVASANGETGTRYLNGNDLNSNLAIVSFEFNKKNDIVTVGSADE